MARQITKAKAKKILSHGTAKGKSLTGKQRRYMGAKSSGKSGCSKCR